MGPGAHFICAVSGYYSRSGPPYVFCACIGLLYESRPSLHVPCQYPAAIKRPGPH